MRFQNRVSEIIKDNRFKKRNVQMSLAIRKWLPFALCCAPGAIAALLVAGVAFGGAAFGLSLNSPLGIGLLGVAMLACPVSMIWMMRGMTRAPESADAMNCCAPQVDARSAVNSLNDLRAQRTQLEREIAALQRAQN